MFSEHLKQLETALGREVAAVFSRHLDGASAAEFATLEAAFDPYLEQVRDCLGENEFLDINLAERLVATCRNLISACNQQDAEQVALVVAGIRYFLDPDDAEADCESVLGFDDDAQVVNWVIQATGLPVEPVALEEM